jgi:hypothetical protein
MVLPLQGIPCPQFVQKLIACCSKIRTDEMLVLNQTAYAHRVDCSCGAGSGLATPVFVFPGNINHSAAFGLPIQWSAAPKPAPRSLVKPELPVKRCPESAARTPPVPAWTDRTASAYQAADFRILIHDGRTELVSLLAPDRGHAGIAC